MSKRNINEEPVTVDATDDFSPGINFFRTDGMVVVTFVGSDGVVEGFPFLLDVGNHYVKVPPKCRVYLEHAPGVKWGNVKHDPHNHIDTTPHEVTVTRPRSYDEEVNHQAMLIASRYLNVSVSELEAEADLDDFDVDQDDHAPLSVHQIREMAKDAEFEAKSRSAKPKAGTEDPLANVSSAPADSK